MPEHDRSSETSISRGPVAAHLEHLGRKDLLPASHVKQLSSLIFHAHGYEMTPNEDGTSRATALNELGALVVDRITSTPERVDYFTQAVAQAAYRAGIAKRPDWMRFGPNDGSAVQDIIKGRAVFDISSGGVVPEEEDQKVYELLIKAVKPVVIDHPSDMVEIVTVADQAKAIPWLPEPSFNSLTDPSDPLRWMEHTLPNESIEGVRGSSRTPEQDEALRSGIQEYLRRNPHIAKEVNPEL